jgi:hypothetical protein
MKAVLWYLSILRVVATSRDPLGVSIVFSEVLVMRWE